MIIKFFDYTKLLKILLKLTKNIFFCFGLIKKSNITCELIDYKKPIKFLPNNYIFSYQLQSTSTSHQSRNHPFSLTISRTTFLGKVAE